jgi:hypothetical protein
MKLLKAITIIVVLFIIVILYVYNTSKIVRFKGITIKVPFVNKKVRTESSLMVLKYPLNGTSLFISDTKMTKTEFIDSYMVAITEHYSNVEKKELKIERFDVPILVGKSKTSGLEKVQMLIPDKKVILKITGNENDIKQLMDSVLKMRFDK